MYAIIRCPAGQKGYAEVVRQQQRFSQGDNPTPVTVRMPEILKQAIAEVAHEERRSENAVMIEALRKYVEQKSAAQPED